MNRAELFESYLTSEKQYIVYNGVGYTLLDTENEIVIQTNTGDEMFNYIKGFTEAMIKAQLEFDKLKVQNDGLVLQNNINIKNYEKVILEMGQDSFPDSFETSPTPDLKKEGED